MWDKKNKIFHYFVNFYFVACCLACLLVTLLPWWPTLNLFIIPKYLLLFGPRWWLLVIVLLMLLFWRFLSKRQFVIFPLLVALAFNYLDFQLPNLATLFANNNDKASQIKVITFNIGGGSKDELQLLVKYMKPDILLLQEALKVNLEVLFDQRYYSECISGLCILSKFPFQQTNRLNRKMFGGWGTFATFYNVITPYGELSLANIHLETPRSVLMGAIYRHPDQQLAESTESNRELEVNLLNLWATNRPYTIIAGDFNMPADENLYQQNFSLLNNVIEVKGFAFNRTKYTSWHGARIDHILYSDDISLSSVEVVERVKGDHRPVMATLVIKAVDR
ncbi:endonuclease/exonuclease/phosphatase family protein [Colwellia psychrerythraea]|uniref:Endonuclease/exonuclease/phosphatase family n=1 Tax=Colwellia psychrerythraea (strain 34H / ATCC BAA-681) TaxID=167879 RepID=Q47U88_COLP3|nr:endonuclease/exonuclease/phosphatase family protein [Colwellia psychrerythraea]AAZ28433.1 endonuclease/exonuclease/phosphatase family [Colwellia psychrerythraea 34H]